MSGARNRGWAWVAVVALVAAGCSDGGATPAPTTTTTLAPATPEVIIADPARATPAAAPLGLRLSEGAAASGPAAAPDPVADGTPLSEEEIEAILARLPKWNHPARGTTAFTYPPQTVPPPRPGEVVPTAFPPPTDLPPPETGDSGSLSVVRYQPVGAVEAAPFISVTFDQPMVAIATLEQLDDVDVPVRVEPAVDGRWRWIGTNTLRFEVTGPVDRLPAATDFEVTIPAEMESSNGYRLDHDVTWTFSTPPPTPIAATGVTESMSIEPVIVLTFDQQVDPEAVLPTVALRVGAVSVAPRLATAAEVDADVDARREVAAALPGRTVALTVDAPLPGDAAVVLTVGPDTPSAEGPLVAETATTFEGRTFGNFTVRSSECSSGDGCEPGSPFVIIMTNPIDADRFDADMVSVVPAIPNLSITIGRSTIELSGDTTASTTYRVSLAADLTDVYGQDLGEAVTVTFDVGPARPALSGFTDEFLITDPGQERATVSVATLNHSELTVRAWAVDPSAIGAFRRFHASRFDNRPTDDPDWPMVLDKTIPVEGPSDRWVETVIDLTGAFDQVGSQLVVEVSPTEVAPGDDGWRNLPTVAWVQRTTLGVDVLLDNDEMIIWTTDLVTGVPIPGVAVELIGDGRVATTDEDGLVRLDIGRVGVSGLWATADGRTAFAAARWDEGWTSSPLDEATRWYVFDDRGVYRPGETAHLTGWVRDIGERSGTLLLPPDREVSFVATDPLGNELVTGTAELNALGGFHVDVPIPKGTSLGDAQVQFHLERPDDRWAGTATTISIQEFRRPKFRVTARTESPGPFVAAEPATVAVDAAGFTGGPVPGAEVSWLVSTRSTHYRPPGWDEYQFGDEQPWWHPHPVFEPRSYADMCIDCWPTDDTIYEEFAGTTDATGSHHLAIDFDGTVDEPHLVTAEATVFDVDRQAWASRTDLVVHAAHTYVGIKTDQPYVAAGDPIVVDLVATGIDGEVRTGRPIAVTAGRVEWVVEDGVGAERVVEPVTCNLTSSEPTAEPAAAGAMRCEFPTAGSGTYRIVAVVTDEAGHANRSELTVWVSGDDVVPTRSVDQEVVTLVPDRREYAVGATAELLVDVPFAPFHALVTLTGAGFVDSFVVASDAASSVVEIPITEDMIPGVTVRVDAVGAETRSDLPAELLDDPAIRPAAATGTIGLAVPAAQRVLDVRLSPGRDPAAPGSSTSVTATVTDADGAPVEGAQVALVVVDEALLSITGYELGDPIEAFYRHASTWIMSQFARSEIRLGAPGGTIGGDERANANAEQVGDAPAASEGGAPTTPADPIDLRSNFDALAAYVPDATTGDHGTVTVDIDLPDNLTRYRIMAVAVSGTDRFGTGEANLTARLPIQIEPSAPRFLNYGDAPELSFTVINLTGDQRTVDVALQTSNLRLRGFAVTPHLAGRRISVPANGRVEVRFPARAAWTGTARFRVAAVSQSDADAATGSFPVYTPATTEAFARVGSVDDGVVAQPIAAPSDVYTAFGGLEVTTSSTALQNLTDAVLYLSDYRFDSTDGHAARIIAIATLRDVLEAFDAEGLPSPTELEAKVARDIEALAELQNEDGGFSWWRRGQESVPWVTIEAARALVVAGAAGYDVPPATTAAALRWLGAIDRHIDDTVTGAERWSLHASAIEVRRSAGERTTDDAETLFRDHGDELQIDAVARLWPSLTDPDLRAEAARQVANRAVDTAGGVTFATGYEEGTSVIAVSDRTTDAVVLDALLSEEPDSELVVKVANGILAGRSRGHWTNSFENAAVLVALRHYFDMFETTDPDFVARVWLGETYLAQHDFQGRSTDRVSTGVPMPQLVGDEPGDLVLQADGTGRMYYRVALRYAPKGLQLGPRDEGFVVDRVYEAIDDPDDVVQLEDGTWRIRAGARVRVTLTMVADAGRSYVALVDPLPAGLEPVNPALVVSQTTPPPGEGSDGDATRPWWTWYEHQNLRDDRVEAMAGSLAAGTYDYSYIARATTPGRFVVAPARAEEIYAPETFGRSASTVVVIANSTSSD